MNQLLYLLPALLFSCIRTDDTLEVHPEIKECIEDARIENALNSDTELIKLYADYRVEHEVSHHERETPERRKVFKKYLQQVRNMKKNKLITWKVGITPLAHLTDCEVALLHGANVTEQQNLASSQEFMMSLKAGEKPPKEWDWRTKGAVTPVQTQLGGTCWSHAAVVPIEAQIAKLRGFIREPEELSTQELIDCASEGKNRKLSDGGTQVNAWKYVKESKRLGFRSDIPDKMIVGSCSMIKRFGERNAIQGFVLKDWYTITLWEDDTNLLNIISTQSPVAIIMATKDVDLTTYKSGDYDWRVSGCKMGQFHAMSIVGYTEKRFIIKNSWGVTWGKKGYLHWLRTSPHGFSCNLYNSLHFPVMEKEEIDWEEFS